MHELVSAARLAASCSEHCGVRFFKPHLVSKHDECELTVEAAALGTAVSVRDQAEHLAVAERSESGQDIWVELDILKAVLQIDGIEARSQIAIVDSDALQSANERLKPNLL